MSEVKEKSHVRSQKSRKSLVISNNAAFNGHFTRLSNHLMPSLAPLNDCENNNFISVFKNNSQINQSDIITFIQHLPYVYYCTI